MSTISRHTLYIRFRNLTDQNLGIGSLFGAAFPLFTAQMYASLGIHWAASVPAFLALACIPFPLIFFKYGPRIRAKCKFAAEAAKLLEELRENVIAEDPEAVEDEAMEEVEQADKIEKLVKTMSRQSRRSHRGAGPAEGITVVGSEAETGGKRDVKVKGKEVS